MSQGFKWGPLSGLGTKIGHFFSGLGAESDSTKQKRNDLNNTGAAANQFANTGQQNYGAMTQEAQQARDYLRSLASGQNSVSAEQLRQGNQQALAQQQAMAASASPANGPMAARSAAMNAGRISMGLSGQQAVAGLQEREQAQKALNDAILGARGQDLNAALGSRSTAVGAYGGVTPEKSWLEKYGGAAAAGASLFAK